MLYSSSQDYIPSMAYSNDMVHIAQSELQQLIRQDTRSIREPKQRMIRKYCSQPHGPGMQDSLVTQTTQACMPMHDLNLLSEDDIPEYWEEGEDGRKSRFSIDDKKRYMVDLETIRKVPNASSPFIRVSDDDDFMTTVDELSRELVDVAFNAAGLGEKEIADHRDVVWHLETF